MRKNDAMYNIYELKSKRHCYLIIFLTKKNKFRNSLIDKMGIK